MSFGHKSTEMYINCTIRHYLVYFAMNVAVVVVPGLVLWDQDDGRRMADTQKGHFGPLPFCAVHLHMDYNL